MAEVSVPQCGQVCKYAVLSRPMSKSRGEFIAIGALAALSVVFWFPCIVGGKVPVAAQYQSWMQPWRGDQGPMSANRQWDSLLWDSVAQFYPWRLLLHRAVHSNQLPLWSPYQYCGYPIVGNGQLGLFYPPNWLLVFLNPHKFLGISLALHFFLAGLFTFCFCRLLRLSILASLFAALAFSYGGFMITWAELPSLINTVTWLPGALVGLELIIGGKNRWGTVLAAVCLGLALLAGHMQIAAYVWLTAAVYGLVRLAFSRTGVLPAPEADGREARHTAWRGLWPMVGAAALGLALGMGQLLPTVELGNLSPRGGQKPTLAGWEFQQQRALKPVELATFVAPNALGTPARGNYRGISYSEHCGFAGISTLMLVLLAVVWRRDRWSCGFAIAILVVLSMSMAGTVAELVYFAVPKLGLTGSFSRLLCVYTLCLAVLAALGLDHLMSKVAGSHGRRRVLATIVGLILIVVLLGELWPWGREFLPLTPAERVYPTTEAIRQIQQHWGPQDRVLTITPKANWSLVHTPQALLPPNSATVYGYYSVQGYDSLSVKNYFDFARKLEGGEPAPIENGNMMLLEDYESGLLHDAAVKWIVSPVPIESEEIRLQWQGEGVYLYEKSAPLRVWAMARPGSDVFENQATITSESLNSIEMRIEHDWEGPAWVHDTYYPGWRAFIDGEPTDIETYRDVFRQVRVPQGEHPVFMAYYPATVLCGLFISLIAVSILVGLLMRRGINNAP